jgi:hypothetical protein
VCQSRTEKSLVSKNLDALGHARRKFAALLNLREQFVCHGIPHERIRQQIRGGHCILNRKINTDAPDGRHRVGRVSDAQKPSAPPLLQTIHRNGQQFDVIPILQFGRAFAQERGDGGKIIAKRL